MPPMSPSSLRSGFESAAMTRMHHHCFHVLGVFCNLLSRLPFACARHLGRSVHSRPLTEKA